MQRLRTQSAKNSSSTKRQQPKFAVIEDNLELGRLYANALKMYGFQTCCFSPGKSKRLMKEDLEVKRKRQIQDDSAKNRTDYSNMGDEEKTSAEIDEVDFILFGHHTGESVQDTMIRAKAISRLHPMARVIILSPDPSVREIADRNGFGFIEKPFCIKELDEFLSTTIP